MHCVFFAMKTAVTLFFLKLKLGWVGASPPWCKLSGGVFCVLFIQIDTHRVHKYIRIVFTCSGGGVFFLGGKTAANPTLLHWPHSVSCISFFSSSTLGDVDILASGTKET